MKFNTRFKLVLLAIAIAPALAVSATYAFRTHDNPKIVVAASNASQLSCISGSTDVDVNQCVAWVNSTATNTSFMQISLGLLLYFFCSALLNACCS